MQTLEILTHSARETKTLGSLLAKTTSNYRGSTSIVISLEGELGSGKTTFTQGFAKGLGVKENPRSPTFVIMQAYSLRRKAYSVFIHVDAYRLKPKDFKVLNWGDFTKNPHNIILVEWGNKIASLLSKKSLHVKFKHIGRPNERMIKIFNF